MITTRLHLAHSTLALRPSRTKSEIESSFFEDIPAIERMRNICARQWSGVVNFLTYDEQWGF